MERVQLDERYADETCKIRKANRHMYWAGVIMNLLIWPFLIIDGGLLSNRVKAFPYFVIVIGIIYMVLGFYINYMKQGDVKKTRVVMNYFLLLIYIGGNMGSTNITVGMIGFGVAVASLMYGDVGVISKTVVSIGAVIVVKVGVLWNMYPPETKETQYIYLAELLLGIVLGFCTWSIGRLNYLFTASSRLALMKEKDEQKRILDQVLEIVETVQENSEDASEIVAKLRDSSEHVSISVEEISNGNQSTCDSMEQQTQMTQAIQRSLEEAAEKVDSMVEAFTGIEAEIARGMEMMKELTSHSKTISEKSSLTVKAMEELGEKTLEMQAFAENILGISNQTNLLALNASIESARAGEAGRGFAVVADEIRELSEQTRQTTEKITQLIENLNKEAVNVSSAIGMAGKTVEEQNHIIEETESAFTSVKVSVDGFKDMVNDIRNNSRELLESNNVIVDSISQLSAVTEEVTAGSNTVSRITEENKESAIAANEKLQKMIQTSHKLDKYIQQKEA